MCGLSVCGFRNLFGNLGVTPGMKAAVDHLAVRASQVHCRRQHSLSAILSLSLPASFSLSRARSRSRSLSLSLSLSLILSKSIITPTERISLPIRGGGCALAALFPYLFLFLCI